MILAVLKHVWHIPLKGMAKAIAQANTRRRGRGQSSAPWPASATCSVGAGMRMYNVMLSYMYM